MTSQSTTVAGTAVVSDQLIEQVSAHLAQGGTLGDLRGLTDAEYEAAYYVGHTLYERTQFEEASKVFAFLVMHNPYDRRFSQALGSALQMRQQYADAIGYYMAASVMDATDPVPVFHIAECLAAQGQLANARDALGFVVRLCKTPAQSELRARADAILTLMTRAESSQEAKP